jgi:excisionase family DNA binding protein
MRAFECTLQQRLTTEGGEMNEILAVSVAEAARRLGVSHRTIGYLIARGELYSQKIGRRRIIPLSALVELLREERSTQEDDKAGKLGWGDVSSCER